MFISVGLVIVAHPANENVWGGAKSAAGINAGVCVNLFLFSTLINDVLFFGHVLLL